MYDRADKLWSVRGIPEDVRKLALEAARAEAVPIGQWVSHAIRQTAASDPGGPKSEIMSDAPSDRPDLAGVLGLAAAVAQLAHAPGCGGSAGRLRALLDQQMDMVAVRPLPKRRAPPKVKQITSEA